jgi:hypothetical protein
MFFPADALNLRIPERIHEALSASPKTCATVETTYAGSVIDASSTNLTPSGKTSTSLREPGLTDAAGTGQRQEWDIIAVDERANRSDIRFPAQERIELGWEA